MIIFCILINPNFEDQTEIDIKGKLPSYPLWEKKKKKKKKKGQMQGKEYLTG